MRLEQSIDTKYSRAGNAFGATLSEPIVVGDRVAVPAGTPFTGTILESKSSGRFKGRAALELELLSFNLRGEAIVNTPTDAIRTFFSSGMDALVIGSYLVEK